MSAKIISAAVPAPAVQAPRSLRAKDWLIFCIKLLFTAGLLLALTRRVEWRDVVARAAHADRRWIALGVGAMLACVFLVAERWRHLAARAGAEVPAGWAIRATFAGLFIGQFLPSTVGSDGARLWFLWRAGRPLRGATASIVLDRVSGLLGVLAVMLVGLPRVLQLVAPEIGWTAAAASIALGCVLAVLFLLDLVVLPARLRGGRLAMGWAFLGDISRALRSGAALRAFALSFLVQLLSVAAVVAMAAALGLELAYGDAIGIVSTAILLSTLPISINGWGVREGAMVAGLALIGVGQQDALLISVLFGLATMAASIPGSVLWLMTWETKPR